MKLRNIESKLLLVAQNDPKAVARNIEKGGKTSYQSMEHSKLSASEFIEMVIKRNHGTVLEHGYFILEVDYNLYNEIRYLTLHSRKYLELSHYGDRNIISGSIRSFRELYKEGFRFNSVRRITSHLRTIHPEYFKDILPSSVDTFETEDVEEITDIELFTDKEKMQHVRVSANIVANRGVSHEAVRHDEQGITQESTRFCNYYVDRFGNNVTFIDPREGFIEEGKRTLEELEFDLVVVEEAFQRAEQFYLELIERGVSPQMARNVLPIGTKTEWVASDSLKNWHHFFTQRTPKAAHPEMRVASKPLLKQFQEAFPKLFSDIKI